MNGVGFEVDGVRSRRPVRGILWKYTGAAQWLGPGWKSGDDEKEDIS